MTDLKAQLAAWLVRAIPVALLAAVAWLMWRVRATGDVTVTWSAATSSTGGINSLASSSTWLAGYEWFVIDLSTSKSTNCAVWGNITVGTTPTANTEIRLYAVPVWDGTTYPDVFDGTPSAETVTSAGIGNGYLVLCQVLTVDAATSNAVYPFSFDLGTVFPAGLPKKVVIFVTHNCGAALNATAGNQSYNYQPGIRNVSP